jgi:hypothetical protein
MKVGQNYEFVQNDEYIRQYDKRTHTVDVVDEPMFFMLTK